MLPTSKYKTGQYYKACLYSRSPDWVVGCTLSPNDAGHLIASICINKAIHKIDIAIDTERNTLDLFQKSLIQIGIGFAQLGLSSFGPSAYSIDLQSQTGTTHIPSIKKTTEHMAPIKLPASLIDNSSYYYAMLGNDSEEWSISPNISNDLIPIASILINMKAMRIDIALDPNSNTADLIQRALIQIGIGLVSIKLPSTAIGEFSINFQTNTGTIAIPIINKLMVKGNLLNRFIQLFSHKHN